MVHQYIVYLSVSLFSLREVQFNGRHIKNKSNRLLARHADALDGECWWIGNTREIGIWKLRYVIS